MFIIFLYYYLIDKINIIVILSLYIMIKLFIKLAIILKLILNLYKNKKIINTKLIKIK